MIAQLIDFEHVRAQMSEPKKRKLGFAAMDPALLRSIASKGGSAVPAEKRTFSVNAQLASDAGKKGGRAVDPAKRSFSKDRDAASNAGKKGAKARKARPS